MSNYDEHTLFFENNKCSKAQVMALLGRLFAELEKLDTEASMSSGPSTHEDKYIINFNPTKGKDQSYAYILSSRDYHRIIGNKADGTPNTVSEFVLNSPVPNGTNGTNGTPSIQKKFNWADEMDDEEQSQQAGKWIVTRKPIVTVPGCVYLEKEDDCLSWKKFVRPGEIAIMRASPNRIYDHLCPDKLIVYVNTAKPVTKMQIRKLVSCFANSKDKQYPIVGEARQLEGASSFLVQFDPHTTNGQYAKIMINGSEAQIYSEIVTIRANYKEKDARGRHKGHK